MKPLGPISVATPDRASVIGYLSDVIDWYRHLPIDEQSVQDPFEILFAADDRQMAAEVLALAFEYARAEAAQLKAVNGDAAASVGASAPPASRHSSGYDDLVQRHEQALAALNSVRARVAQIKSRLRRGLRRQRQTLTRQLVTAQSELDLAQSHADSLDALIAFESAGNPSGQNDPITAQIDALERSVPQFGGSKDRAGLATPPQPLEAAASPSGLFASGQALISVQRKDRALAAAIERTARLSAAAAAQREPLLQMLREIDRQGSDAAAEAGSSDIAAVKESKAAFNRLTARHKLVADALLPLSRQIVVLNLYTANLDHWRHSVGRQFNQQVHRLLLRLAALTFLIAIVGLGAYVWRKLTFLYVIDIDRRHQLMRLRRLAVGVVVALILIFNFANELGALATVMGFAAAGIAFTLQNVILSLAGYFYLSGRFGLRIRDRVQISGITGDVLEIGLFKLTLMELSEDADGRQPTGRVVVFPNSVVFLPNGNFFKQIPGANYTWNEMRLTVAPDCDYRLAQKRIDEVLGEVVARYRDTVQREYHDVETSLSVRFETPRPQSRFRLTAAGLELVVRYPVPLPIATQTADEIARRMVEALKREPALRLVTQGTPALQAVSDTPGGDGVAPQAAPAAQATPAEAAPAAKS